MPEWEIKIHPDFFKDLDKLSAKELEIFNKKRVKIKENPERQKHLSGGFNCYREPITDNARLVYLVEGRTIWFLAIGLHDKTYGVFRKRLYSLRTKYGIE